MSITKSTPKRINTIPRKISLTARYALLIERKYGIHTPKTKATIALTGRKPPKILNMPVEVEYSSFCLLHNPTNENETSRAIITKIIIETIISETKTRKFRAALL